MNHEHTSVDLASVRSNILVYCGEFPQLVRNHGGACIGSLTLQLGKCFKWIGPTLDLAASRQPLPGELFPSVAQLGEELRVIGLKIIDTPGRVSVTDKQIDALNRQLDLLKKIGVLERGMR